jgi:hypothetical protein
MFQTKFVEEVKTHILFSVTFFCIPCLLWDKVEKCCRAGQTIWRMRIACWIPKATDTHSEYVILIAFPLQQWLHIRTSMLRYTQIACLFIVYINPIRQKEWKRTSFFYSSTYVSPVSIILPILRNHLNRNSLFSEGQAGERRHESTRQKSIFTLSPRAKPLLTCLPPHKFSHIIYCNKCFQKMGRIGANYSLLIDRS